MSAILGLHASSWRCLDRAYPQELIEQVQAGCSMVVPQTSALRAVRMAFNGRYRQVRCTQGWLDDVELEFTAAAAVRLALWLERLANLQSNQSGFLINDNPAAAIQAIEVNLHPGAGWMGEDPPESSDALDGRIVVFLQVLAPKHREDALFLCGSAPTLLRLSTALLDAASRARSEGTTQWLLPKQEQACPDTTPNSCVFAICVSR
ncbi:MAG: hypothetical protein H4O13_01985 [Xanthomonadales bacterium]|nr:hypothetical protein [Xanthomonadales bacterium]